MTVTDVVQAWTDVDYREALGETDLATLPAHPAGSLDDELRLLLDETYGPEARTWGQTHCCNECCGETTGCGSTRCTYFSRGRYCCC